jgi:hypothetical protein
MNGSRTLEQILTWNSLQRHTQTIPLGFWKGLLQQCRLSTHMVEVWCSLLLVYTLRKLE